MLAVYGGKDGYPYGSRSSSPYLLANVYYPDASHPNGGVPFIFLNDQAGDVTMSNLGSISSSTWFTLKIQYDTTQSKYSVYVNGALQGSYVTVRESQRYIFLNQALIMSPDVDQKRRNFVIWEGVA